MAELPFVTIINPIRNVERTIETNLRYLLDVDYPKDRYEIVFGDGGSKDRTVDIIREWQKKYDLIKIVIVPTSKSPEIGRASV